eukprot:76739-Pelagomonas_calceolata.AAC.1
MSVWVYVYVLPVQEPGVLRGSSVIGDEQDRGNLEVLPAWWTASAPTAYDPAAVQHRRLNRHKRVCVCLTKTPWQHSNLKQQLIGNKSSACVQHYN